MWLLMIRRAGKDLVFLAHDEQEEAIAHREDILEKDRTSPVIRYPILWTAIVRPKDKEYVSV